MKALNQPYGHVVNENTSLSTFNNYVRNYIYQPLAKAINSIGFGTIDEDGNQDPGNIDGQWVTANFTTANTDLSITHTLGRVPSGYIIMSVNAATIIYTGESTWTSSTVYLRSNTANVSAKLLLV